jgi:protein-S-isoprenylcysteine O-methyltransferase Ste14
MSSGALFASLSTLVAGAMAVEGQALYQHFAGLDALKTELMRRTTMDADFKSALLARVQSGRIFANFSLPNTLAGLVTMILPIQAGLLSASFFPSRLLKTRPGWITILTSRWARLALIAGIMLSIWVLALTQSFGGWVGLCCSLGTVLFVWLCRRSHPRSGRAPQSLKMAFPSFVPLGKGDAAHRAAGGPGGTHPGANAPPLPGGDFHDRRRADWIVSAGLLLILAGAWLTWTSHKRGFRLWNLKAAENPITLRLIGYGTALNIFRDFPVTGVGLGNYGTFNPRYQTSPRLVTQFAHNTPLQLLSEGGVVLVAGLLFVGVVGIRWKSARNQIQNQALSRDPLYLGMMGSLAAWLVHNALDIDLYFPSLGALGFFVLGLLLNYPGLKVEEEETDSSRLAGASIVLIAIALGLALLTGIRFQVSRSLLDLAGISASSNNWVDANRYARWAVKIRPQDAAGIVFLGKLETQRLKQEGKPIAELLQTLSQSLKEAVRLDPYNAEFHFELSRVYKALGNEELSDQSRARAVALFPSEPKYRGIK